MYPRAEAYIISVKQSTYCQFGEVIRAHTGGGEGERECWTERERNWRQEMAEKIRERRVIRMYETNQKEKNLISF